MNVEIQPISEYLRPLDEAVAEIANTWRPDDPAYQADVYRQIMMQLSYGYFAAFNSDPEHPDWSPLFNPVFMLQPNPDDIYYLAPIDSRHQYRISGNRGTCKRLIFNTQFSMSGMPGEIDYAGRFYHEIDDSDIPVASDGTFEVLVSADRPPGHVGGWLKIEPGARVLMTRSRSYDWETEIDPQMAIECLTATGPKRRLGPEEILERVKDIAWTPARSISVFYMLQNKMRQNVGVNTFEPWTVGSLAKQTYMPAVFEFDEDEALILETELPARRPYWNFQLNDPYFNAVDYVYRLSSTNGHFAKVSTDGRFRAVISLEDPGVPNWLDPGGFLQGTVYGRWYDCDSSPTPTLTRVKFAEVREYLPADTPTVSAAERAEEVRRRVRACQRRRRW
jgi:hypothetical protein